MKKKVVKLFLMLTFMLAFSLMFGASKADAVDTSTYYFADSIYVGGVKLEKEQYLESNKDYASSSLDDIDVSNGFAYFSGNSLTLYNYTYEGESANPNGIFNKYIPLIGAINNEGSVNTTLSINLVGTNNLTHTSKKDTSLYNLVGIYVDGSLEINGTGILNINSFDGIYAKNRLAINGGKTNIFRGNLEDDEKFSDYAIVSGSSFNMNDGVLNVYSNKSVRASSIAINGGSILVSSNEYAFSQIPDLSNYESINLTVAQNADGSSRVFPYAEKNYRQYKYFSIKAPAKTDINSINVNEFTEPTVGSMVEDIEEPGLIDGANYYCEYVNVLKKVEDNWVILASEYVLKYNEDYRVVMSIMPNTGYTFVTDGSLSATIKDKETTIYELVECADFYGAKIGYEFKFETTDTEVTSFSTTLELPKINQVYGDIEYSSDDVTCSEGFSYSTFQIYEGTTELEETKALEKDVIYTLVLGFELEDGYYAFDIENATINGNAPTYYQFDGNILVLSYEFTIIINHIDTVAITNFKTPSVGQKFSDIDINEFLYGEGYEFVGLKYFNESTSYDENTVIEYDTEYRYAFFFKAVEGYELSATTLATINGESANCYYDEDTNQFQVNYVLKYESKPIDAVFITGVVFPEVGDKVVDVDLSGVSYANHKYELYDIVCWFSYSDDEITDDTILQYDIEYAYTFVFVAKEGYKFIDGNALINGDAVSSWYGTHDGDETVYFEAYYYHFIESDKKEITEIEIYNYDIPNVGQKLSDVVNTNDTVVFGGEYKIVGQKIAVHDYDLDETLDYNGEIQREVEYTLFLLLEAKEGYKFSVEMDDTVIFNSYRAYCHEIVKDGKRYMQIIFWFNYPELSAEKEITSIEILNVEIPKVGQTLSDTTNTPDTILWGEGYEITNLVPLTVVDGELSSYIPMDYEIDYNEEYAFVFEITPKEGYVYGLIENVVVNNERAFINGVDSRGVMAIVYYFSYKAYEIYVADKDDEGNTIDVQVSDMNKDDVLGDGTVSYDPKTNTLTLNNYTYDGEGFLEDGGYAAIFINCENDDTTILLKGENVITISSDFAASILIYDDNDIYIEGTGSLEINSTMHGIGKTAEYGAIIINGPFIDIISEGEMTTGIFTPNFILRSGTLKINSLTIGIITMFEDGQIDIYGGSIEISVSVAGNAFAYLAGGMTFVSKKVDLELYETSYKVIAGTKSDGSNATDYDEELANSYKYFKIEHSCSYTDEWLKDTINHYKECACGETIVEAHNDANNDGKCDVCGYNMPISSTPTTTPTAPVTTPTTTPTAPVTTPTTTTSTAPKESKNDSNAGIIAVVSIVSVLAAGGAGFGLYWFKFRRRKDLE